MITLATLLGGVVGVLLRTLLDWLRPPDESSRLEPLAWTVAGAFVLGIATGATLPELRAGGVRAAVNIGLSGTLFTYCLISSPSLRLFREAGSPPDDPRRAPRGRTVLSVVVHALVGFCVAVPGVLLAVWLIR